MPTYGEEDYGIEALQADLASHFSSDYFHRWPCEPSSHLSHLYYGPACFITGQSAFSIGFRISNPYTFKQLIAIVLRANIHGSYLTCYNYWTLVECLLVFAMPSSAVY